jgi:hypothetical protein
MPQVSLDQDGTWLPSSKSVFMEGSVLRTSVSDVNPPLTTNAFSEGIGEK